MLYEAPVATQLFALRRYGRVDPGIVGCDPDSLAALLTEAGRFATARLLPLWAEGDRVGARFAAGRVTTPPGFAAAFRDWAAAGWNAAAAPAALGGAGLPLPVGIALLEIWSSANMALMLCPLLGQAAIEVLRAHASPALRAAWVPALLEGRVTATMALTEPQAGSDLGALRCRAAPDGAWPDGAPRFRVRGTKIFTSWGEHDLTDNILHLVLARLPGAPEGTRGISLFLVPKRLPDGRANDLACTGIEHKLGIHGSPTCSMAFGDGPGALGWMIGAPHRGLAAMFTMMNRARLATGLQGVALAERAAQQGGAYAALRRQFGQPIGTMPDGRRMLRAMQAAAQTARAIAYETAGAIARAEHSLAPADAARAALLTPIAKTRASEAGVEAADLNLQLHGGLGYVEATGAAQLLRDARIVPIYEGTNGIQAIDLLTRRLLPDGGAAFRAELDRLGAVPPACEGVAALQGIAPPLTAAIAALGEAGAWLLGQAPEAAKLAGAVPFLRLFALVLGTALMARAAAEGLAEEVPLPAGHLPALRYAASHHLAEAAGLARIVTEGAASVLTD